MKFGADQVSGIGVDQFRAAVNYTDMVKDRENKESGVNKAEKANKGYVRFTTSGRSVVVSKVNNQIDIGINLAINVNETNNRLIRRQFLRSIQEDIKFMPADRRQKIVDLIIGGASGTDAAKPLARREIAAILKEFDVGYNTSDGRRKIISNMLAEAAGKCYGRTSREDLSEVDIDTFCVSAFGISQSDFIGFYEAFFARKEAGTCSAEDKLAGRTLVRSEEDFRAVLITVKDVIASGVNDLRLNSQIKTGLSDWAASVSGDYGFTLDEKTKSMWKDVLRPVLARYPGVRNLVPEKMAGTDFPGRILDLFVDNVLPHEYETAVKNVQALGIDVGSPEFTEAAATYLDVDSVCDLARAFFAKATDAKFVKSVGVLAANSGDKLVNAAGSGLNELAEQVVSVGMRAKVQQGTAYDVAMNSAAPKEVRNDIAVSHGKTIEAMSTEAKLKVFAESFVSERYGDGEVRTDDTGAMRGVLKNTLEVADREKAKLVIASQLQYGQRFVKTAEVKGKTRVVEAKNGAGGFERFVGKVLASFTDEKTLKTLRCSWEEAYSFASYTLPNIFEEKKGELDLQNAGKSEKTDLFAQDFVDATVAKLKDGYRRFAKDVAAFDKKTLKFDKAFDKLVGRYAKGGRLAAEVATRLLIDAKTVCGELRAAAARELASLMPLETREKRELAESLMLDAADRYRSKMNRMLKVALLARGYSCQLEKGKAPVPAVEVFKTGMNVADAMSAWKQANGGTFLSPGLSFRFVSEEEVAHRLANRITDVFHATLSEKLPSKDRVIPAKKVTGIREAFTNQVGKELSAFREFEEKFENGVLEAGSKVLVEMMKAGDEPFAGCKGLGAEELKAYATDIVRNEMVARRDALRKHILAYADHPDRLGKKTVYQDIWNDIESADFGRKVDEIVKARADEVGKWLEGGELRLRLEDQIFARFSDLADGSKLTGAELRSLVHANAEPFFVETDADRSYAARGGRIVFLQRATDAMLAGLEDRIRAFVEFKAVFAEEAEKVEQSYATLPGKDKIREGLLLELSGQKSVPSLKPVLDAKNVETASDLRTAAAFYEKRLNLSLRNVIEEKRQDFAEYALAYRSAYSDFRPRVMAAVDDILADKLDLALTKANRGELDGADGRLSVNLLREHVEMIRSRLLDHYACEIARNPNKMACMSTEEVAGSVTGLVDRIVEGFEGYLPLVAAGTVSEDEVKNGKKWGVERPWEKVDALLVRLGYADSVLDGNAITEGLRRHLSTLMSTAEYVRIKQTSVDALVTRSLEEAFLPSLSSAPVKALDGYDGFVRAAVENYLATTCNVERLNQNVELAKARVDLELNRRKLPTVRSAYGDTVRERSYEHFLKHVKTEAEKMFAASAENEKYEPGLMTKAFFDEFISQIENDALSTGIRAWLRDLSSEVVGQLAQSGSWRSSLVVDENLPEATRSRCQQVADFNRTALEHALESYALTLIERIDSYENFSDSEEQRKIRDILVQKTDKAVGETLEKCRLRMEFELNLDHAVETAVASYERILFLRMFAVSSEEQPVYGSLEQLCGDTTLPDSVRVGKSYDKHRKAVQSLCADFRQHALDHVNDLRKKIPNLTETVTPAQLITEYGNKYLQALMDDAKMFAKEKKLLNELADKVAKVKKIKIDRSEYGFDIPGFFSFITDLFRK